MYVCRSLSYKGAEFEVIETPLDERMMVLSLYSVVIFWLLISSHFQRYGFQINLCEVKQYSNMLYTNLQ